MVQIKIFVITTTFPRWKDDTTPTFVYELSKRLQKSGLEIVILAPHDQGAKKLEIMDDMKIYRFPYFYPFNYQRLCYNGGMLPNFKTSYFAKFQTPIFMLIGMYYIFKITNKEKIDLIHAHWIIPSGLMSIFVKLISRIPLIISVHGSDISLIKYPFLKSIIKQILKNVDMCTVNSTATKDLTLNVIKSNKRLKIIPMGVDLNIFKPKFKCADGVYSKKRPTILTVGRLDKKKGMNYLIDAMPEIIRKFPKAKLVIVGDGPEKNNITMLIKKLNLDKNVDLIGAVQNKNLPSFYQKADLFVLPSLNEGLGVVLLEAMACGTPVIGSNVGGITDIIINGENGFLTISENPQNLAEKIITVLSNNDLQKKFSENGFRTIKEKFSWDVITDEFLESYGELK